MQLRNQMKSGQRFWREIGTARSLIDQIHRLPIIISSSYRSSESRAKNVSLIMCTHTLHLRCDMQTNWRRENVGGSNQGWAMKLSVLGCFLQMGHDENATTCFVNIPRSSRLIAVSENTQNENNSANPNLSILLRARFVGFRSMP